MSVLQLVIISSTASVPAGLRRTVCSHHALHARIGCSDGAFASHALLSGGAELCAVQRVFPFGPVRPCALRGLEFFFDSLTLFDAFAPKLYFVFSNRLFGAPVFVVHTPRQYTNDVQDSRSNMERRLQIERSPQRNAKVAAKARALLSATTPASVCPSAR